MEQQPVRIRNNKGRRNKPRRFAGAQEEAPAEGTLIPPGQATRQRGVQWAPPVEPGLLPDESPPALPYPPRATQQQPPTTLPFIPKVNAWAPPKMPKLDDGDDEEEDGSEESDSDYTSEEDEESAPVQPRTAPSKAPPPNARPAVISQLVSGPRREGPSDGPPPSPGEGEEDREPATRVKHERLLSVGEEGLRSIEMMRAEAEALKQGIVTVIRESYQNLAPAMKIAKVTDVVVDMVDEAMTILTKFVRAFEAQRESFRSIFTEMRLISDEMQKTEELKRNEAMQAAILKKLFSQRTSLKEHATRLRSFASPADLDRFMQSLTRFEQV